ncbi:hypothetical protein LTR36_007782 [Oleoguttula mirabilis]|uniref:Exocyst complex component SEC5 n=1 Tax=Oleoguttula mirabilis TaxID=1507867 RepID=A0AAV9J950_9PEZI|nr:hypothetical protein LTR36_007782 [Oleoguttula mirabilis]
MPISAHQERQLLNHYKLTNLYPDTWPHPADDDNSSDSDPDDVPPSAATSNGGPVSRQASKLSMSSQRVSSTSKFRNIDRHASIRSANSLGPDSVVQKDEPDPLGMAPSVAGELRRRGLPVEEDLKLRNRFMLSSTSFSPALFLSQVHQDASTEDLLRGLDFLSKSIEQKSASLKVLVESNFEKFVRAKGTIDNVYTEMRTQGADDTPAVAQSPATPGAGGRRSTIGQRRTSKSQTHFRNASGAFSPTAKSATSDKKKNALTKESEYGVLGIKAPLQDLAIKAEEVWGPALGGREKEETLKSVLSALEQHREIFGLPGVVDEAAKKKDYDTVIASWKSAQKYADQARQIAASAKETGTPIRDQEAQQILVTAKMYHDVSLQVDAYKREIWRRLKTSHGRKPAAVADDTDKEEHMELIGVLLQLGVDDEDNSPIWEWLHSRYLYLKDKIARTFERSRIEIEILRRRLAANDRQDARVLAKYLRSAADGSSSSLLKSTEAGRECDTPAIIHFWEKVHGSLRALLSSSSSSTHSPGVLAEVLDFWHTTQSFIDNKAQQAFPAAVFAAAGGLEHLELEPDDVANLRSGTVELVEMIRESVMGFFADAPVEDLSELYSPVPPTPITPDSAGGAGQQGSLSSREATGGARAFRFDLGNVPPPSPKRGEAWEKFAFWPPYANALSGSHYLSRILALIGTAASEMAALSVVKQQAPPPPRSSGATAGTSGSGTSGSGGGGGGTEGLKSLVSVVRERCVQALCAAWTADTGERFKHVEQWRRAGPERRDLTTMPAVFMAFEERVLANFQKVAYISEAAGSGGGGGGGGGGGEGAGRRRAGVAGVAGEAAVVVTPPPAKLLQAVRGSFVTSLYKALSGMVENAERGRVERGGEQEGDVDGVTVPVVVGQGVGMLKSGAAGDVAGLAVDASNRNIRMLMTLSNLAHLRADIIPHLISHFEAAFAVKLTEESKTIRDVLGQIDARLFQSYVKPTVDLLNLTITAGIGSPGWAPQAEGGGGGGGRGSGVVGGGGDGGARPTDARAYVYEVLLMLVLVHSEVSTTASGLTNQILSYLLEQASLSLLAAFSAPTNTATNTPAHYSLPALMQATLDVEFLAQTLNNYTTDRAGEVQSQIYLALDERTDDQARLRLQGELPEMRGVLKRLREGTKGEFGCFRRERRGREGRGGGAGAGPGGAGGGSSRG